jgi:hypothetical protein
MKCNKLRKWTKMKCNKFWKWTIIDKNGKKGERIYWSKRFNLNDIVKMGRVCKLNKNDIIEQKLKRTNL